MGEGGDGALSLSGIKTCGSLGFLAGGVGGRTSLSLGKGWGAEDITAFGFGRGRERRLVALPSLWNGFLKKH